MLLDESLDDINLGKKTLNVLMKGSASISRSELSRYTDEIKDEEIKESVISDDILNYADPKFVGVTKYPNRLTLRTRKFIINSIQLLQPIVSLNLRQCGPQLLVCFENALINS